MYLCYKVFRSEAILTQQKLTFAKMAVILVVGLYAVSGAVVHLFGVFYEANLSPVCRWSVPAVCG